MYHSIYLNSKSEKKYFNPKIWYKKNCLNDQNLLWGKWMFSAFMKQVTSVFIGYVLYDTCECDISQHPR